MYEGCCTNLINLTIVQLFLISYSIHAGCLQFWENFPALVVIYSHSVSIVNHIFYVLRVIGELKLCGKYANTHTIKKW